MSSDPVLTSGAAKAETLCDREWPPALTVMPSGRADGLNVYPIMARHSAPAQAGLEPVSLRTGRRLGAEWDRSQPIELGRRRGLSDARIGSARAPLADMTGNDAPRRKAVGQVLDASRSAEETLEAITHRFGKPALYGSMATVGLCPRRGFGPNHFRVPIDRDNRAGLEAGPLDDARGENCPDAEKGR
ncbi:hypothetical protein [Silicimonas sp. MF1-12-2]|uniref:hypothetical protein n=1 Tax=Silicimonas sp. MF1-12-2 TaxID=3384793 RepID=UPI0039B584F5